MKKPKMIYSKCTFIKTTGHGSQTMNVGAIMNKGIEIELDAQVLKTNDFSFEILWKLL